MEKIGVFCASSNDLPPSYYEEARRLGRWLGEHGKTLVYGGNNCGLMEAVAQGAHETGGKVYGVIPKKLVKNNQVSECVDIAFHCNDLFDRKQWLVQESDIMVALPGSAGTLDEAFCALAAHSFGMNKKRVVFWNMEGFYDTLFKFLDEIVEKGATHIPWRKIMSRVDTLEELTKLLQEEDA